jgi:glycerol 2-dehydrogenase (NADP+)
METGVPMSEQKFKLNTGHDFPVIGLGTFLADSSTIDLALGEGEPVAPEVSSSEDHHVDLIVHALQSGYRLLDTAQLYQTEEVVGKAVRRCGIPRDEITIVTKFPGWFHGDPKTALDLSLANLGLDYIDVFMMHWPISETLTNPPKPLRPDEWPTFVDAWEEMEKLVGPKCKAIGVNNFTERTLNRLLESATIIPAINQVELHVYNPNLKLVSFCQAKGIHVMGWR